MSLMITSAKLARECIGMMVYWDDIGTRYIMRRRGVLHDVSGKNVLIDGDWKWRPYLTNLRCDGEVV